MVCAIDVLSVTRLLIMRLCVEQPGKGDIMNNLCAPTQSTGISF